MAADTDEDTTWQVVNIRADDWEEPLVTVDDVLSDSGFYARLHVGHYTLSTTTAQTSSHEDDKQLLLSTEAATPSAAPTARVAVKLYKMPGGSNARRNADRAAKFAAETAVLRLLTDALTTTDSVCSLHRSSASPSDDPTAQGPGTTSGRDDSCCCGGWLRGSGKKRCAGSETRDDAVSSSCHAPLSGLLSRDGGVCGGAMTVCCLRCCYLPVPLLLAEGTTDSDVPFLVQSLGGMSWKEALETGVGPPLHVVAASVLRALLLANSVGVCHGDIKLANIVVPSVWCTARNDLTHSGTRRECTTATANDVVMGECGDAGDADVATACAEDTREPCRGPTPAVAAPAGDYPTYSNDGDRCCDTDDCGVCGCTSSTGRVLLVDWNSAAPLDGERPNPDLITAGYPDVYETRPQPYTRDINHLGRLVLRVLSGKLECSLSAKAIEEEVGRLESEVWRTAVSALLWLGHNGTGSGGDSGGGAVAVAREGQVRLSPTLYAELVGLLVVAGESDAVVV